MKTIKFFSNIAIIIGLCHGAYISTACSNTNTSTGTDIKDADIKNLHSIYRGISTIKQHYVLPVEDEKMIEAGLAGMASSLDPHSSFFTAEETKEMQTNINGEFGGIGAQLQLDQSFGGSALKVVSPIDDLPAQKAGIVAGELIVEIDGESVGILGFNNAIKKLRGDPGTKVAITIFNEDTNEVRTLELTRATVKIHTVKSHLKDDILYLRIPTFNANTIDELEKAVDKASKQKKIAGMILDLRNNPGGLLDQSVRVAGFFINTGTIVTIKERDEKITKTHTAQEQPTKAPNVPLVVLINNGSASASEIVAGAIQDHKRGLILGTTSFGKGSVQGIFPLDNNTSLKLTIALYYTPNDKSIQAEGIVPDIIAEQVPMEPPKKKDEKDKKFSESSYKNHIKNTQHQDEKNNTQKKDIKNIDQKDDNPTKSIQNTKNKKMNEKKSVTELIKQKPDDTEDLYNHDYQYTRAVDLIKDLNIMSHIVSPSK